MRKGIRGHTESRPFFSGSQDELVGLMEGLLRLTGPSSDPMSEFYLRSLANLYWLLATSRNPVAATSQKQARYVGLSAPIRQKVERFMRLNLASRIELHDMASVVNMSQSHFRRAFQISVGIPPHQFLLKLRIEAAERLLLDTDLPVATIALNCGFASQSHVTKVMQQFRGVTPGALRRSRRVRAEAAD
ncbi:HTH-type transcriptional activator RhaR [Labrys miyagiensis]